MTRPETELWSPGPLANTLPTNALKYMHVHSCPYIYASRKRKIFSGSLDSTNVFTLLLIGLFYSNNFYCYCYLSALPST